MCLHAKHAAAALKLQMNKTDRNDTFGLARLVSSGWCRPVGILSMETYRLRVLLIARNQLVGMSTAIINKMSGLAKIFDILVGAGKGGTFERQVRATLPDDLIIAALFESLLAMLGTLREQQLAIAKQLKRVARQSGACRLMMAMPGVGPLTAVSFMNN